MDARNGARRAFITARPMDSADSLLCLAARWVHVLPAELEFLKRLCGLGTEEEEGYRTDPPGYIGWRNSFLGIDSGAPYTFKNTSSELLVGP